MCVNIGWQPETAKQREYMPASKVLVMGDDLRSFLAVVRSLGSKGISIDTCPINQGTSALRSRYIDQIHHLPSYNYDPDNWIKRLKEILSQNNYDLIIPCTDQFIIPIHAHAESLKDYPLAIVNDEAYETFYDKALTRELADNCQVPIARGRLLQEGDSSELLISLFGLPLIIKPRSSFAQDTLFSRNRVHTVKSSDELDNLLGQIKIPDDFIVESCFPGYGAGISILAGEGEVLLAFQHQRVHEPREGGGSSYRKSVKLNPELLRHVAALARATKLTGVSMFEFKINPEDQAAILVEVNARFWGSLPLAIGAGVDFPYHLYQLLVKREVPGGNGYRSNFYGRNLTNDVRCLMSNLEAIRSQSIKAVAAHVLKWSFGFCRVLIGREKIDSLSFKDPVPFILEVKTLIWDFSLKFIRTTGVYNKAATYFTRKRFKKIWLQAEHNPIKIAVICSGNICRSPFAAEVLKKIFQKEGIPANIKSYGLLPMEGRTSPDSAINSAQNFGIDLSSHRSTYADDDVLRQANIILVFDELNVAGLSSRSKEIGHKVVKMGNLAGIGNINDPYAKDIAAFNNIYEKIFKSAEEMLNIVRKNMHSIKH